MLMEIVYDATDINTAVHILSLQLDGEFLKCSYFSFMFFVIAYSFSCSALCVGLFKKMCAN